MMAGLFRLQSILSHFSNRSRTSPVSSSAQLSPNVVDPHWTQIPSGNGILVTRCSGTTAKCTEAGCPVLHIQPESGLADEMLDIQASGLQPGQLVTLRAQVFTEGGKYRFLSTAEYRAGDDGTVNTHRDPSLGGSYEGIEPMGLIWGVKPAPEVLHKHPRLAKVDVSQPFRYTIDLLDGSMACDEHGSTEQATGQGKVLDSKLIERRYLADYVEQIPLSMGQAEGVLFLPKERGLSDPLPFIIDIRGLLTKIVVDRAAILASHGFAVFAFDYFLPRRKRSTKENVFIDGQAFLDIIDYVKSHPRLDETRIGMTSSCYGGAMMMHAATRLNLPVKCLVGAGFFDVLNANVGFSYPDGRRLEPYGPTSSLVSRWQDKQGNWWMGPRLTHKEVTEIYGHPDKYLSLVENMNCPLLIFGHFDDQHSSSLKSTLMLVERLKQAGKGHLVEYHTLPGTGHFLEVPYQSINTVSSLYFYDTTTTDGKLQLYYANYGGKDTTQAARDQQFAWRKIVNFFRKHLEVREMYRTDWISD